MIEDSDLQYGSQAGVAATKYKNLTQSRKDAKRRQPIGIAATDVAKAMSLKKERKEHKKRQNYLKMQKFRSERNIERLDCADLGLG